MSNANDSLKAGAKQLPEKKWAFAGGVALTMWLKELHGRWFRSITVQSRRYRDPKTGEWKNGALRPSDLSALGLAIEACQQYMATHPLPGPAAEEDELAEGELPNNEASEPEPASASARRPEDIPF